MSELRKYIEDRSIPIPFVGCWMWLLSFGSHGYGNACKPGVGAVVAHRLSYEAFKGQIPSGMLVQHTCDNKWCVNPDHLSLGTDQTNSDDKWRKGRANLESRKIPPHPRRKLTDKQVNQILEFSESPDSLASRFGVTRKVIWAIRNGRHYVRESK